MKTIGFNMQAHMPDVQFVPGVGFVEGGTSVSRNVGSSLSGEADIAMISGLGADAAPSTGFSFDQVPWWGWLAAGVGLALAFMALKRR